MKLAILLLTVFSFQFVFAQDSEIPTPVDDPANIDSRQQHQEQRIKKGINSGSISKQEARHLKKEQARIKRLEKRSKKDGKVSAKEKKKINHAQNHANRSISKKKHNKK